jgi:hypothetical protein
MIPLHTGIAHSVGKGGTNLKSETRYVQSLLNIFLDKRKGTALQLDGLIGPKTITTIEEFQRFENCICDGRVDPHGTTIARLEEQIGTLTMELAVYFTLALALSYDPRMQEPRANASEFAALASAIFPRRG